MGPKGKPKTPKGKEPEPPNESVTQVEKEFFEFTLSDIEKKLDRIAVREEELKTGSVQLEEKIEELKKEKGVVITEHEQVLAIKDEEKIQKRDEIEKLGKEIKTRVEKHKMCIEEWKSKYEKMVEKYKEQVAEQEEEIQDLEYHKQNKDNNLKQLEDLETQMQEAEMQHKRNLFEIQQKRERAIMRIKKEVQSRILHFPTEFRKTIEKKVGKPCHRISIENKAIQNLLIQMKEEILEYQEKSKYSKKSMIQSKNEKENTQLEKDKMIARTVIQLYVIKELTSERVKLSEKLKTYAPISVENRNLTKKFQSLLLLLETCTNNIKETKKKTEGKIEETKAMKNAISHIRKRARSMQVLIRSGLKIAEEAIAVRLIPIGKMEGEKYLPTDIKIRLFKKRRDSVFEKRGKILQYLLDILSKAQISEDDKKLLKGSSESLTIENINFSSIYGKMVPLEELERLEAEKETDEEKKRKGPMFFTSTTSLPRSLSALVTTEKAKSEGESYEGGFGEYGEYDEEEEIIELERGGTELFDDFDLKQSENSEAET